MENMPLLFENKVIKAHAEELSNYIKQHVEDFGELGDDYWKGRQIYMNQVRDPHIVQVMRNHKDHMLDEFTKLCGIDKPVYVDSLHFVRWTEGYELHPHADAVDNDFPWRDFGTVTFLNEDFEGGVLYYPNKDNLEVPAKTGYTAIHTGGTDCLHGVTKMTKGARYTIASFITYDQRYEYKV